MFFLYKLPDFRCQVMLTLQRNSARCLCTVWLYLLIAQIAPLDMKLRLWNGRPSRASRSESFGKCAVSIQGNFKGALCPKTAQKLAIPIITMNTRSENSFSTAHRLRPEPIG